MPSVATREELFFLVALLLPGFIIATVRNVFVVQRNLSSYQEILAYIFGSAISHLIGAPLWYVLITESLSFWQQYACLAGVLLIIPLLIGLAWSWIIQHELIETLAPRLGLFAVHHVNTAWDWKFSRVRPGEWVLVTLKDGTEHAGYIGSDSFFASGDHNRDLYIEQVYDLDQDDNWTDPGRRKSILIPYSEVRTIVFWPDSLEIETNAREANN